MPKVWILPGDSDDAATKMFQKHGWEVVWPHITPDLICFLGGTDVDPEVYGAERHPMTQSPDKERDEFEVSVFNKFKDIPKVGICRGGQLLNVLNGGTMIQHLGKTISGVVQCHGKLNEPDIEVLVDHHQGMVSGPKAYEHIDRWYDTGAISGPLPDYVIHYPETKSLCFQPHPEWGHKPTEDYFFELLGEHLAV